MNRDQKKGLHEQKRKENRKRMKMHRLRTEGKIGPDNRDLAHHHGFNKLTKAAKKAAELAEATNATPDKVETPEAAPADGV